MPADLRTVNGRVDRVAVRWGVGSPRADSMLRPRNLARLAGLVGVASACGPAADIGVTREQVVVGEDGRIELFEAPAQLQSLAREASFALLNAQHVVLTSDGAELRARSLSEELGVCDDERFAEQPSAAFCSGVLIDDDLVATAGHCLAEDAAARCRQTRLVLGFGYVAASRGPQVTADRVFSCKRVVTRGARSEEQDADFAVIQLDRSAADLGQPVGVRPDSVVEGEAVDVASHGAGLPLKVERGASVLSAPPGEALFSAATDTFSGSSGGPLFDSAGQLVGLVKGGASDWSTDEACARARHMDVSLEIHQHAQPIQRAVCAAGWPSERLCDTRSSCGDGVCNADESPTSCAADCQLPMCGDGLCEWSERGACTDDCNRHDEVPLSWPSLPETYWLAHPPTSPPLLHASGGCSFVPAPRAATPLLSALSALLLLLVATGARRR